MSRSRLLITVDVLKRNPSAAQHMTAELEEMLASDDPRIWMRAVLAFAQSVAADQTMHDDMRAAAADLIAILKPHLNAQAN